MMQCTITVKSVAMSVNGTLNFVIILKSVMIYNNIFGCLIEYTVTWWTPKSPYYRIL